MEAFITLMQQQQQPSTSSPSATTTSVSSTITKKIASRYLTRILLRSDGLHSLIEALVPATTVATANSGGNDHDQNEDDNSLISPLKLDALARIVLAVPVKRWEWGERRNESITHTLLFTSTVSKLTKNTSYLYSGKSIQLKHIFETFVVNSSCSWLRTLRHQYQKTTPLLLLLLLPLSFAVNYLTALATVPPFLLLKFSGNILN